MNIIDIPVNKIKTDFCIRQSMGDILSMTRSIRSNGLLQPLGVTSNYQLVYGRRRLEACRKLDWQTVPVVIIDNDAEAYLLQRVENNMREDMTITEKSMFAQLIEKGLGIRAGRPRKVKDVMEEHPEYFKHYVSGAETVIRENFPELPDSGRSRDIAAKEVGLGNGKTYHQARTVVEKGTKKLQKAMDDKKVSISAAAQIAKLPKEEQDKLDYDDPKALKQKAKVLRMKKTEEAQAFDPEVMQLADQAEDWPDEKICQLIELLEKRVKRKGLVVIDGGKD